MDDRGPVEARWARIRHETEGLRVPHDLAARLSARAVTVESVRTSSWQSVHRRWRSIAVAAFAMTALALALEASGNEHLAQSLEWTLSMEDASL